MLQQGQIKEKENFTFSHLPNAKFASFNSAPMQELLYKWGMKEHIYMHKFSYDKFLNGYEIKDFLLDFVNDANVQGQLRVLSTKDTWGKLGKVSKVDYQEMETTVTSMDFFDRLKVNGIVRSSGEIVKCMDEYVDSFIVSDELRKCLLMPEFESFDLFSNQDRCEFIFHLFKSICLGGRLCQYEDTIEPYIDTTKGLYKDLIAVSKQNDQIKVISKVFKLNHADSAVSPLFPLEHVQNFCFIFIDPLKRHVNVFYHASDSYY